MQFINQEAFLSWYASVISKKKFNEYEVLNDVVEQYSRTHIMRYEIPAEKTESGKPEGYDYTFEDIGKCGGSELFIYF